MSCLCVLLLRVSGTNPVQLTRGMDKTVAALVKELAKLSTEVANDKDLANVAAVSAGETRGRQLGSWGGEGANLSHKGYWLVTKDDCVQVATAALVSWLLAPADQKAQQHTPACLQFCMCMQQQ